MGMCLFVIMKNRSVLILEKKIVIFGLNFMISGVRMVEFDIVSKCCRFMGRVVVVGRCLLGSMVLVVVRC